MPAGCARSSSTPFPTTRIPQASASRASGAQPLVELARRYGFLIVEDVAYRELGFEDDAAPSLWSLAPDTVVQAGTTSKTFFPGVRLGWAVGPAEVSAQLVSAKQNTDQCAGALGQRLFEEYVRRGWIDEQLGGVAVALPAQVRSDAGGARARDARGCALDPPDAAASSRG